MAACSSSEPGSASESVSSAETADPDGLIGRDEAAKTARDQVDGVITKWKIEGKDTRKTIYELDIRPLGASEDQEVRVDAEDGSIVQDS